LSTLIEIFRCLLPRRFWKDSRNGAYLSIFLTAALAVRIGYAGFMEVAQKAGEEAASAALKLGAPGTRLPKGVSQVDAIRGALQGPMLVPFFFFVLTPTGWLVDYLFLSAIFRGITLAVDNPWGDPILTVIDSYARRRRMAGRAEREAAETLAAQGPLVPDQILECRKFAGKDADYVIVASRRKEGWVRATTVIASSVRLRIGEPLERPIDGFLRTCYPLSVIRDIQVDRRIVHYDWPADAPSLPAPDDDDVWAVPESTNDETAE